MSSFVRFLPVFAWAITGPLRAEPYWIAWEGANFPENEGWERRVNGDGPAQRTINDGVMTIDGSWSTQVDDYYRMLQPVNPWMNEEFVMEWRLKVDEVIGNPLALYDPGVAVFSDDDWTVSLLFGVDFVRSFHEDWEAPLEPGVFHTFEFRSVDMRNY